MTTRERGGIVGLGDAEGDADLLKSASASRAPPLASDNGGSSQGHRAASCGHPQITEAGTERRTSRSAPTSPY